LERIELDEEIPELIPKSPIPRHRKVTLKELIESLNKAIATENRRIKKEIVNRNALRESGISLPKRKFSIRDKIKDIHTKLVLFFDGNSNLRRIGFSEFIGDDKAEKIGSFYPLLQLENQHKVWLDQERHFEEIYIWLKETYLKHNPHPLETLKEEMEKELEELDKKRNRIKKLREELEEEVGE
jgi:chromatin segregation and condensation protein Rec8/ScpA/Scc1 (kleisin family)